MLPSDERMQAQCEPYVLHPLDMRVRPIKRRGEIRYDEGQNPCPIGIGSDFRRTRIQVNMAMGIDHRFAPASPAAWRMDSFALS